MPSAGDRYAAWADRLMQPLEPAELVSVVTQPWYNPSEVFALAKAIDGEPNAYGSFPLAGVRASHFLGQRNRQFFYEPLENYQRIAEVLSLNHRLRQGGAPEWSLPSICVAFETYDSIFAAPRGRVPLPGAEEKKRGDHYVFLTGGWEESGRWLQFENWWGPDWGDTGRGYLSADYLDRYLVEAWLTRDASIGPSLFTYRRLIGARSERELARIWLLPNPRWHQRGRQGRLKYRLVVYESLSAAEECPVQVIEVRTAYGVRIAWAHLFHLGGGSQTAALKELFVWPSFRRKRLGTVLEKVAAANARQWGADTIRIQLHEMDALPSVRGASKRFAERLGYEWRRQESSRPRILAVAEKRF